MPKVDQRDALEVLTRARSDVGLTPAQLGAELELELELVSGVDAAACEQAAPGGRP
jgi:hypothetical protein